jgi:LuxR family maltose regulon positive regulatory protein
LIKKIQKIVKIRKNSSITQVFVVKFLGVMTMTFSLHENFEFNGVDIYNEVASTSLNKHHSFIEEICLFPEKLQIPKYKNYIKRPRLIEVLEKSSLQFGATLVSGRAGTGKTALAAEFADRYKCVAWLSADSADSQWNIFSAYFSAALENAGKNEEIKKINLQQTTPCESEIKNLVENLLENFCSSATNKPSLIVLDDAHYIFDAEWFNGFFNSLLYSLSPETHLLILSRGAPSVPLWRLRSKQVLGVVDEKLLAFDINETRKLFRRHNFSAEAVAEAHSKSFGRISRLEAMAETP